MKVLMFILQLIAIFLQEIFENILHIFIAKKPKQIKGQLALITGGAHGLGRAIAFRLAQEGCNIAICDLNLDQAEAVCMELKEKFSISSEAFKTDVSNIEEVKKLRENIEMRMGRVDILVNNAGILSPIAVLEGEDCDVQRVLNVNIASHFWMLRTFLPSMIEHKRGHIVAISSAGAKSTIPFAGVYCTSKFALDGLYNSLYDDMCIHNYDEFIKITTVFPGFINTRQDLKSLLDNLNSHIPCVSTKQAANEIVNAMLFDKREHIFPFFYKIGALLEHVAPRKTMKYAKNTLCRKNINLNEMRLKMIQS